MSLVSFSKAASELATVIAIDISAKDVAGRYASAQVALQIAAAFQAASTGDVSTGLTDAEQALLTKVTDPGQALLVQTLFTIVTPYVTAAAAANNSLPLVDSTIAGACSNIAAGIKAAASAYPAPASAAA